MAAASVDSIAPRVRNVAHVVWSVGLSVLVSRVNNIETSGKLAYHAQFTED
jgi:hypothetical protein